MRKTIALCMNKMNGQHEVQMLYGIMERAKQCDMNVVVYDSLMDRPHYDEEPASEAQIEQEQYLYELINYKRLSGMIVLTDVFLDDSYFDVIKEECDRNGVPLITIDSINYKSDRAIKFTEGNAMEKMVEHLITEHGCRKIDFIGGFKGNQQTEERLEGYKTALARHDIPFDENRIGYGKFWKEAYTATEELLKYDLPDAFVCANDTMAVFCGDCLKNNGYSIPEDVIITGYDGIDDSTEYSPTITTVINPGYKAGMMAVNWIFEGSLNGVEKGTVNIPLEIDARQSCGCVSKNTNKKYDFYGKQYGVLHNTYNFLESLQKMNQSFLLTRDKNSMYEGALYTARFLNVPRLYICIRKVMHESNLGTNKTDAGENWKNMISMVKYGHDVEPGTEFSSDQLIPEDIFNDKDPVTLFVTNLFFSTYQLGYAVFELNNFNHIESFMISWISGIGLNASSFYFKASLDRLSETDSLTGLYNLLGFKEHQKRIFRKAVEEKMNLTVFCIDVDGLKKINDNYGHEAGDIAIIKTAEAIGSCMTGDFIASRTGGDEFNMIAVHEDFDEPEKWVDDIYAYLGEYNAKKENPFDIMCSCGYKTLEIYKYTIPDCDAFLEKMRSVADMEMYIVKTGHKAVRTD
ncbi:MAG: GGDEF domain-containing protein [Lachnospiraceae bacterium]|nr:GGDEF domain-containing protein [Lachnospiraceae bacterium]